MSYADDIRSRLDREFAELDAKDAAAKENGTIVGRYLKEPAADSHAYYEVVEDLGDMVRLERIDICDGWSLQWIEDMGGVVPKVVVEKSIQRREAIAALFAKQ